MSVGSDTRRWIEQNIEKVAVVAVLVGLLVSAAILVTRINEGHRRLADTDRGIPPDRQAEVPRPDLHRIDQALARLAAPPAVGATDVRMWVSALRVHCIDCMKPIDFHSTQCPFCGARQPEDAIDDPDRDTVGDGIPDVWKEQYGLDILDPYLHMRDLDGDGFTVLEEYRAGTNPTDPEDSPPPVMKLRVERVLTRPFRLRFLSVQELIEGEFRFQLNDRVTGRTRFVSIGDEVSGYRVVQYDEGERALTVVRGENRYVLHRGRDAVDTERTLELRSLIDNELIETQVGRTFEMRGVSYDVIELRRDGIRVREVSVDEPATFHVGHITEEEREALQRRPVYDPDEMLFDEEGFGDEMWPARPSGRPPARPPMRWPPSP